MGEVMGDEIKRQPAAPQLASAQIFHLDRFRS